MWIVSSKVEPAEKSEEERTVVRRSLREKVNPQWTKIESHLTTNLILFSTRMRRRYYLLNREDIWISEGISFLWGGRSSGADQQTAWGGPEQQEGGAKEAGGWGGQGDGGGRRRGVETRSNNQSDNLLIFIQLNHATYDCDLYYRPTIWWILFVLFQCAILPFESSE